MKKFGHYEVTAELGRGGMGVVYKGWEPSLNRKVAIKCLGEHLLNDKDLVERFTREAKATAAVNDPNVIQIYFIGKEGDQPFFAMEYIEGQSLDDILKGGFSLPVQNAKNILKQACKGMAAAHKLDLVHRDIKPANLMLTTEGILKVVDFGIARTREYGDKLTNTGEFVGTPGYLSPEVCIGKEVDERSDIFSLGIVFYEMLAGKVPFENDSPLGLMLEVVQSDIPDIRALNKKVDKKTSFILNKMIAKSPDDRYQNCAEIIRDLGNTIDNESLSSIKTKLTAVAPSVKKANLSDRITLPGSDALTAPNLTPIPQSKGSKKWMVAATLFAVLGAGAFGYYNGYLPIPKNSEAIDTTQAHSLANLGDINTNTDSNLDNEPAIDDLTSSVETKPIIDDQSNIIVDDNQDTVSLVDNTQIDFPEELIETQEPNDQVENQAGFQIETTQELATNKIAAASDTSEIPTLENAELITDQIASTKTPEIEAANNGPGNAPEIEATNNDPGNAPDLSQVAIPVQTGNQTVAHNTENKSSVVAETKTNVPPIAVETIQTIAKSVKKPVVKKPRPVILNKGVVVIAFGDPAIANPVEKLIETQLKQKGIKVMNEQFIPGMRQLVDNGLDLAELKNLIQKNGGQAMVIANVNYVGSQQLNYAGRSSELINAQLDIDTYDIKTGDSIGPGFGSKLSYTSLNATDEASEAVMQYSSELTANLKNKI